MPGLLGFRTLEAVIESGTNAVDISFFPEDPFRLEDRAREKGGTAVVDCMARTTGYTCAAVAELLLDGSFARRGVCPPEYAGAEGACFHKVLAYREERNVRDACASGEGAGA